MNFEKINIRKVSFNNVTLDEAERVAIEFVENGEQIAAIFTPNSEIVQMCAESPELRSVINSAQLVVADGAGVVLASKILGRPLKGKVAGIELGERILGAASRHGWRVYFLGGQPGIATIAAEKMREKYPGLTICGTHDGYFEKTGSQNDKIIKEIIKTVPDVLFVCLGAPAQENWIIENKDKIPSLRLCIGLGGSLDVYSGVSSRAPDVFIKLGLEWFYRLLRQPSRVWRMMKLPKFLLGVLGERIRAKKLL